MKHRIDIRGAMIPNDYKWYYNWFDEDSTCPRDVFKILSAAAPGDEIEVYINSPGGVIDVGSEQCLEAQLKNMIYTSTLPEKHAALLPLLHVPDTAQWHQQH